VPTMTPTIVNAAASLSTGARSSPWKVGSDGTASSTDLASASFSLCGAKASKSSSSTSRTNCIARILGTTLYWTLQTGQSPRKLKRRHGSSHLERDAVEYQVAETERVRDEVRAAVAQHRRDGEPR
jgi:hypothetical protein